MRDGPVELAERIARRARIDLAYARSIRSSAASRARLLWKYRTRSVVRRAPAGRFVNDEVAQSCQRRIPRVQFGADLLEEQEWVAAHKSPV
jgi:hypothetical protein